MAKNNENKPTPPAGGEPEMNAAAAAIAPQLAGIAEQLLKRGLTPAMKRFMLVATCPPVPAWFNVELPPTPLWKNPIDPHEHPAEHELVNMAVRGQGVPINSNITDEKLLPRARTTAGEVPITIEISRELSRHVAEYQEHVAKENARPAELEKLRLCRWPWAWAELVLANEPKE